MQTPKSGPKNWLNLQSAGSGNPLKSHFESKIRAKIFSKSANLLASAPSSNIKLSVYNVSLYTSKMRNPLLWAAVIRDHGSHISGQ